MSWLGTLTPQLPCLSKVFIYLFHGTWEHTAQERDGVEEGLLSRTLLGLQAAWDLKA